MAKISMLDMVRKDSMLKANKVARKVSDKVETACKDSVLGASIVARKVSGKVETFREASTITTTKAARKVSDKVDQVLIKVSPKVNKATREISNKVDKALIKANLKQVLRMVSKTSNVPANAAAPTDPVAANEDLIETLRLAPPSFLDNDNEDNGAGNDEEEVNVTFFRSASGTTPPFQLSLSSSGSHSRAVSNASAVETELLEQIVGRDKRIKELRFVNAAQHGELQQLKKVNKSYEGRKQLADDEVAEWKEKAELRAADLAAAKAGLEEARLIREGLSEFVIRAQNELAEAKDAKNQLEQLRAEHEILRSEHEILRSEHQDTSTAAHSAMDALEKLQAEHDDVRREKEEVSSKLSSIRTKYEMLKEANEELYQKSGEANDHIAVLHEDKVASNAQLTEAKAAHESLRKEKEKLQAEHISLQCDHEEVCGNLSDTTSNHEVLQKETEGLRQKSSVMQDRITKLHQEKHALNAELAETKADHESQCEVVSSKLSDILSRHEALHNELLQKSPKANESLAKLREEKRDLSTQLTDIKIVHESLRKENENVLHKSRNAQDSLNKLYEEKRYLTLQLAELETSNEDLRKENDESRLKLVMFDVIQKQADSASQSLAGAIKENGALQREKAATSQHLAAVQQKVDIVNEAYEEQHKTLLKAQREIESLQDEQADLAEHLKSAQRDYDVLINHKIRAWAADPSVPTHSHFKPDEIQNLKSTLAQSQQMHATEVERHKVTFNRAEEHEKRVKYLEADNPVLKKRAEHLTTLDEARHIVEKHQNAVHAFFEASALMESDSEMAIAINDLIKLLTTEKVTTEQMATVMFDNNDLNTKLVDLQRVYDRDIENGYQAQEEMDQKIIDLEHSREAREAKAVCDAYNQREEKLQKEVAELSEIIDGLQSQLEEQAFGTHADFMRQAHSDEVKTLKHTIEVTEEAYHDLQWENEVQVGWAAHQVADVGTVTEQRDHMEAQLNALKAVFKNHPEMAGLPNEMPWRPNYRACLPEEQAEILAGRDDLVGRDNDRKEIDQSTAAYMAYSLVRAQYLNTEPCDATIAQENAYTHPEEYETAAEKRKREEQESVARALEEQMQQKLPPKPKWDGPAAPPPIVQGNPMEWAALVPVLPDGGKAFESDSEGTSASYATAGEESAETPAVANGQAGELKERIGQALEDEDWVTDSDSDDEEDTVIGVHVEDTFTT
ncbi:uncharacterized protein AB675_92 [Cyphellophora attinorum]|uniref:Uncharacterized protein n=1 Tax=Cyphellophora attinorum TaxID=1664694 RepID=A0A0N0NK33_9EURO|nr:uncharacterized protein AB675_92 [Phialophora attinorum]KPI37681.1 hypothetical protein AB675_92 [Phialophora attinorum]